MVTSLKISNIFNAHFTTMGQKLASRFSTSDNLFSLYLGDSVNESFFFNAVSAYEVQEQISSIPGNKTYGLYSFPTFLLKLSKSIICPVLAMIINMSMEQGVCPSKLKMAKIVPIFKSGDQSEPDNYRPISLLSVFNESLRKLCTLD
jgi:hypothetical protein